MGLDSVEPEVYAPSFELPPAPRPGTGSTVRSARTPTIAREQTPSPLGYELQGELGRGGMAVVYQARQLCPQRTVALKMLLSAGHLSTEELLRFRTEADAVARLQHSNIVQIHEIGDCAGSPFLSLEFVPGGTLAQYLHSVPQSPRDSAHLVETLARAMHFAHEQGIIHRDLKPSNILLQAPGTKPDKSPPLRELVPKISDFGLAKQLDTNDSRTRTGVILGTPSYMAPEQAQGTNKDVGPAVDIYALGAILYELLTGRPPFRGETPLDTLRHVMTQDPVAPSRLQPGVPRDLETICLTCLRKEPVRRYATAAALAEDLRRYQDGEPIQARPTGHWERIAKWARRRPAAAALLGLSIVSAALLLVGALKYNHDLSDALSDVSEQLDRAVKAERATERINLDMQREAGLAAAERGDSAQAALWFAHAAGRNTADPETRVANRLRAKYWSRLAPTPTHVLPKMVPHLRRMSYHPGGRYVLLVSHPGKGWSGVWDTEKNVLVALPVATQHILDLTWSTDGQHLAAGLNYGREHGELVVWSFPELKEVHKSHWATPIFTVVFSPDNKRLAHAGRSDVTLVDLATPQSSQVKWLHPAPVQEIVWSPDGQTLVTACLDGLARVFDVTAGKVGAAPMYAAILHQVSKGDPPGLVAPLIVQGGRGLVTLQKEEATLRDLRTGKLLQSIPGKRLFDAAMSEDGNRVALCHFSDITLWDVTARTVKMLPSEHRNTVHAAAFSSDGESVATVSGDRTLALWSLTNRKLQRPMLSQLNEVTHLAFSPDGGSLMLRQREGLVRILVLARDAVPTRQAAYGGRNTFLAVDSTGQYFLPVGTNLASGVLSPRVYAVGTGAPVSPPLTTPGFVNGGAFSPDGRSVALCGGSAKTAADRDWTRYRPDQQPGWVALWRLAPPDQPQSIAQVTTASEPLGLAYSPNGEHVIALCAAGEIIILNGMTGDRFAQQLDHGARDLVVPITRHWVCFSPDGSRFLTLGPGHFAQLWDARTFTSVGTLQHAEGCSCAEFSSDSQFVVTASRDHRVGIWSAASGVQVGTFLEHPDWVFTARFSPDGHHILTTCRDHTAKLWDWRSRQHLAMEHDDEVFDAVFSRDGRWIVTASRDKTSRVWEARNGRPVCPPIALPHWGYQAVLTADHALLAGENSHVTLFSLTQLFDDWSRSLSDEDLLLLGELHSGQRIAAESVVANLTTAEWHERWNTYRERHPDLPGLAPLATDRLFWHQEQIERLERGRHWERMLPHLNVLLPTSASDWNFLSRRARVLTELKRYPEALIDVEAALKLAPNEEILWRRRGIIQDRLGNREQALSDMTEAIQRNPGQAYAWENRGVIYMRLSRWEEALADFTRAVELKPTYAIGWLNQGTALARLKRSKEAIAAYTKAIELQPDDWRAWNYRAQQRQQQGELISASLDLAKSLELKAKAGK